MVCPAAPGSRAGNRTTALRWAAKLRALGHRVRMAEEYVDQPCDVLIALHAGKSAPAVRRSSDIDPKRPIIVALTGTDLYRDLPGSLAAQQSIALASRIVILHPLAIDRIPETCRTKARVIYQSAVRLPNPHPPHSNHFDVSVVGHLRDEKDPLRAAAASRMLPPSSRIRILHAGSAMATAYAELARREQSENPRYRWLGELSRRQTRSVLTSSRALALTSRMEGGANVISEAVVNGVPVLASRIDGNIGLLGRNYPALFDVGDTGALAALMSRIERDAIFCRELKEELEQLAPLFGPRRELETWRELLRECVDRPET
jgi:putative glycosyltransferase (TIGR04348 family)